MAGVKTSTGTADRRHGTGAVIIACLLLAMAAWTLRARVAREMVDFQVYWTAASRAAAAAPLYRADDGHYQFKYLPGFAVLTAPVALAPRRAAATAWFVTSAVLMVLLVWLSVRLPVEARRPAWLLAAGAVLAMGKFYGHELVLGQVNLLFGVLVAGALLSMKAGRETAAGLLLALAILVKPYAVIFVPWIVARRQPRSIAALAAGGLAALVLPVLLYGAAGTLDLHRDWWRTVTESTAPNITNNDNVSIAAMFAKWLGTGIPAALLAGVTSLIVLASAAWVYARRRAVAFPEGLEGALLLTAIPLLSPQGWDYVFLIATPAVVYLLNYDDQLPPALRIVTLAALAVIGLSLFDVMGRQAYARFMSMSVITVCFLIVAAALAALRGRAAA